MAMAQSPYQGQYLNKQLGNYKLIKLLGEGGFAEVYLGEHIHLGSYAAVKVLTTKLTNDEIAQFREEARTIIRLNHPNIVRILDFGMEGGRLPFIIMDYAPNGSLRSLHPRGTRLPLSTIVTYVKQIASALQYAHDQGLVHRDIKPDNLLVGQNNTLLLSDFGIVTPSHSINPQMTQHIIGTWVYMSPEQINAKPRRASDQYSLGIVVYEWLTGAPPFRGSMFELANQHATVQPPSLCAQMPGFPPHIEQVVLRALAKDPNQRFPSIQAFAQALEEACQKPPIGTTLLTYSGHSSEVRAVAWSPDGSRIASASDDHTVQVWQASTGKLLSTYSGHSNEVNTVAWSPDGSRIASGSDDKTVQVWQASTGKLLLTYGGHSDWVRAVPWSPDGNRIASGSDDKTVQVWQASTGKLLLTYGGHSNWVYAVAWSPDGSRIASGGGDHTVQVWQASTGKLLFTYSGHSNEVNTVAWSPDGSRIASASQDKTVQVWQAV